jgi:hypothetical protein
MYVRAYTKVMLATLACTDMALNTVTKRLSTSHMSIVIEKTQSTFAAMPSAVTLGGGVVNWDRVITKQLEGCSLSGSLPSLH